MKVQILFAGKRGMNKSYKEYEVGILYFNMQKILACKTKKSFFS